MNAEPETIHAPPANPAAEAPADEWPADLPRPTGLCIQRRPPSPPYFYVRRSSKCVASSVDPAEVISKLESKRLPIVIHTKASAAWPRDLSRPKGLTIRTGKSGLALFVVRRGFDRRAVAISADPRVLLERLAHFEATGETRHRPPQPAPLRPRSTVTRAAPAIVRVVAPVEPRPIPESVAPEPKAVVSSRPTGPTLAPNELAARLGITTAQLKHATLPRVGGRYDYRAVCKHLRELAALRRAPRWWNPGQ